MEGRFKRSKNKNSSTKDTNVDGTNKEVENNKVSVDENNINNVEIVSHRNIENMNSLFTDDPVLLNFENKQLTRNSNSREIYNSHLKSYNSINNLNNFNTITTNKDLLDSGDFKSNLKILKTNYNSILKEINELNNEINDQDEKLNTLVEELEETSKCSLLENQEKDDIYNNYDKSNEQIKDIANDINQTELPNDSKKPSLLELRTELTSIIRNTEREVKEIKENMKKERNARLKEIEDDHNLKVYEYSNNTDIKIKSLQNNAREFHEKLSKKYKPDNINTNKSTDTINTEEIKELDENEFKYISNIDHIKRLEYLKAHYNKEVISIKELIHQSNELENQFYTQKANNVDTRETSKQINYTISKISEILLKNNYSVDTGGNNMNSVESNKEDQDNYNNYLNSIIKNKNNSKQNPLKLNLYGSLASILSQRNNNNSNISNPEYNDSNSKRIFQSQLNKKSKRNLESNALSSNRYSQASISDEEDEINNNNNNNYNQVTKIILGPKKQGKADSEVDAEETINISSNNEMNRSKTVIERKIYKKNQKKNNNNRNKNKSQESQDFSADYSSYDVEFNETNDEIQINKVNCMRIDTEFFEKKNNISKVVNSK